MATTTLTTNLKLRVSSDLTSDAKFNLEKIDSLGSIYQTDTNQVAKIRSQTDILLQPQDPDIGGTGSGGVINIGSSEQPAATINLNADSVNLGAALDFSDQATGGDKNLQFQYKSDLNGAVDTSADRKLRFDVEGADRDLVLGGNFSIDQDLTFTSSGAISLTLPTSGTLTTLTGAETLTNKTIDISAQTSVTNIADANIAGSAAIAGTKISPDFGSQTVQTSGSFSLANSGFTVSLTPPTLAASLSFKLPAVDGSSGQVIQTDGSGNLSFTSVATATLPEFNVFVGDNAGNRTAVDTDSLGQIKGEVGQGLTVKDEAITNAMVNNNAAIALSKLAALGTIDRALVSSGTGEITTLNSVTTTELGYIGTLTSDAQVQLDNKQPLDSTLTALASYNTNAILVQTAADTFVGRVITAANSKLIVTDGNGVAGNPTIDIGTLTAGDIPNLDTGKITTGTFADARIAESNVTQHNAAIVHDSLSGFVANEHIDHTNISVNTNSNSGLGGGSNIASNVDLVIDITNAIAETNLVDNDLILVYDSSAAALRKAELSDVFAGVESQTSKTNWTQADGSSKAITHNFGTLDIVVEIYDTADGSTILVDSVVRTNTNTVTLTGANLPGSFDYRVLIREIK